MSTHLQLPCRHKLFRVIGAALPGERSSGDLSCVQSRPEDLGGGQVVDRSWTGRGHCCCRPQRVEEDSPDRAAPPCGHEQTCTVNGVCAARPKMLRRKPTRLELKIDDTEEFESVKKELEARKRQREEAEAAGGVGGASVISVDIIGGGASGSASTATSRAELINERIGYKPHLKPTTLSTLFGSLQF